MQHQFLYTIPDSSKHRDALKECILRHPELKFVSLVGVDFLGNDTDERIPIEHFLKHMEDIFSGGIQTDGSSVNLPGIASINDAKIEFIIDMDQAWVIDYNYDSVKDKEFPVGTIRIPIFFRYHDRYFCSRSLLRDTLEYVKKELIALIRKDKPFLTYHGISPEDIGDFYFTLGTELEFWVRSPIDTVSAEALAVSQILKESYWKRTKGQVRTALEDTLLLLQNYGVEPEMGHKEVGGIKGKLSPDGKFHAIMEQLEIDWRYSDPVQACDNELFARILIKEVFRRHGLEVTFVAKPVEGAAGNGEHMHLGIGLILKNGKKINLFAPVNNTDYLSSFGYGALMGILREWEAVNPFISNTISSLKRLKPGFEAPVCAVASLGSDPSAPSRNRSVLVGLVTGGSPLATRFEVRAPNPHTNTYLAASALYLAMLTGIRYAVQKSPDKLLAELSKKTGEEAGYLRKEYEYLTEKDIFTDFTQEERDSLYGKPPRTVWETLSVLKKPHRIFDKTPFIPEIINSYYLGSLKKWVVEIREKEIPSMKTELSEMRRNKDHENQLDENRWAAISARAKALAKDSEEDLSVFTRLEHAIETKDFEKAAALYYQSTNEMEGIRKLYSLYRKNTVLPF